MFALLLILASFGGQFQPPPLPVSFPLDTFAFELLLNPGVQKHLKLTDAQIKEVDGIGKQIENLVKTLGPKDGLAKTAQMLETAKKTIDATLTKDQARRLEQLSLQAKGPSAFLDFDVGKTLAMDVDQKLKVAKAITEGTHTRFAALKDFAAANPEEMMKKMTELSQQTVADVVKLLTPQQQEKWRGLVGVRYEGTLPLPGFGIRSLPSGPSPPVEPKKVK